MEWSGYHVRQTLFFYFLVFHSIQTTEQPKKVSFDPLITQTKHKLCVNSVHICKFVGTFSYPFSPSLSRSLFWSIYIRCLPDVGWWYIFSSLAANEWHVSFASTHTPHKCTLFMKNGNLIYAFIPHAHTHSPVSRHTDEGWNVCSNWMRLIHVFHLKMESNDKYPIAPNRMIFVQSHAPGKRNLNNSKSTENTF